MITQGESRWCAKKKVHICMIENESKAPHYIRCPTCNRRLKPMIRDCHDGQTADPCLHMFVPPHKKKRFQQKIRMKKVGRTTVMIEIYRREK